METITLIQLRDFLLYLPDDHLINMTTGSLEAKGMCLMSLYGKAKGFDFDYSSATMGWTKNRKVITKIEDSVVSLFSSFSESFSDKKSFKAKWWKDRLKPEYNPSVTLDSLFGD
jgi:hypothetical protein